MSKLSALGHFFAKVAKVAPAIMALSPLAPLAGVITAAIQEAEALHTAGPDKLAHVKAIAIDAAVVANAAAGHPVVDVSAVGDAVDSTVATIVNVVNAAHPKAA